MSVWSMVNITERIGVYVAAAHVVEQLVYILWKGFLFSLAKVNTLVFQRAWPVHVDLERWIKMLKNAHPLPLTWSCPPMF